MKENFVNFSGEITFPYELDRINLKVTDLKSTCEKNLKKVARKSVSVFPTDTVQNFIPGSSKISQKDSLSPNLQFYPHFLKNYFLKINFQNFLKIFSIFLSCCKYLKVPILTIREMYLAILVRVQYLLLIYSCVVLCGFST